MFNLGVRVQPTLRLRDKRNYLLIETAKIIATCLKPHKAPSSVRRLALSCEICNCCVAPLARLASLQMILDLRAMHSLARLRPQRLPDKAQGDPQRLVLLQANQRSARLSSQRRVPQFQQARLALARLMQQASMHLESLSPKAQHLLPPSSSRLRMIGTYSSLISMLPTSPGAEAFSLPPPLIE